MERASQASLHRARVKRSIDHQATASVPKFVSVHRASECDAALATEQRSSSTGRVDAIRCVHADLRSTAAPSVNRVGLHIPDHPEAFREDIRETKEWSVLTVVELIEVETQLSRLSRCIQVVSEGCLRIASLREAFMRKTVKEILNFPRRVFAVPAALFPRRSLQLSPFFPLEAPLANQFFPRGAFSAARDADGKRESFRALAAKGRSQPGRVGGERSPLALVAQPRAR